MPAWTTPLLRPVWWWATSGSFSRTVTATSSPMPVMRWARATPTMPPPTIPTRRLTGPPPRGSPDPSVRSPWPAVYGSAVAASPEHAVGPTPPGRGTAARRGGRARAATPGPRRRRPRAPASSPSGVGPRTTTRGRPGHVTGEVGHAHAALAGHDRAVGEQHLGVEQHELAGGTTGLGVARDVDAERPQADADLGRGQADAVGVGPHGVDQIGGQAAAASSSPPTGRPAA